MIEDIILMLLEQLVVINAQPELIQILLVLLHAKNAQLIIALKQALPHVINVNNIFHISSIIFHYFNYHKLLNQ